MTCDSGFRDKEWIEVHEAPVLMRDGKNNSDHTSLVAAVCPNCHKEIHYGKAVKTSMRNFESVSRRGSAMWVPSMGELS